MKSRQGEELDRIELTEHGLLGDRGYALLDAIDGKAATAKNPRKWPGLLEFRATFLEPPHVNVDLPPVRIDCPNGITVRSDEPEADHVLSSVLHRTVRLTAAARPSFTGPVTAEEYWPDIAGLDFRDTVTDFTFPAGSFFDCASVHMVTTATLQHLHRLHPTGRFEVPRFRPNIVMAPPDGQPDFLETGWLAVRS